MTLLLIKYLLSYLLGSLSGSLIMGRMRGVDIRTIGSGNAGATNALRTQGFKFALFVLLFDVGKGMLAATVIADFGGPVQMPMTALSTEISCGLACAIGHCYPVWFGFRGGKGAGTLFGAHLVVTPLAAGLALLIWVGCLIVSGYVGLSTLLAAATLAVVVTLYYADFGAALVTTMGAVLIFWAHRMNIQRLRAGTENRFERVRLFKSRITIKTESESERP
jgi:glycerol-3-phosphate acyltransferase PlsY